MIKIKPNPETLRDRKVREENTWTIQNILFKYLWFSQMDIFI